MKLFKWETNIKPKFPNVIEKFFGKKITEGASVNTDVSTVPSVNISNAGKAFEIDVALPGLDKKDVKIEIQNNCLVISSEKQYEKEDKNKNWIRKEYGYAAFQRMFQLPEGADAENIKAEMKNGILAVKIEKQPGYEQKIKQIAVK
jgi:HSP20 family protein